jgi:hypothetical protein
VHRAAEKNWQVDATPKNVSRSHPVIQKPSASEDFVVRYHDVVYEGGKQDSLAVTAASRPKIKRHAMTPAGAGVIGRCHPDVARHPIVAGGVSKGDAPRAFLSDRPARKIR